MRWPSRSSWSAALLVSILAGASAASEAKPDTDVSDHPKIGTAAPDFELKAVDGKTLHLADLEGQFVVIHFGTSW